MCCESETHDDGRSSGRGEVDTRLFAKVSACLRTYLGTFDEIYDTTNDRNIFCVPLVRKESAGTDGTSNVVNEKRLEGE